MKTVCFHLNWVHTLDQRGLQIQCITYQNSSGIFHRAINRTNNSKIGMKPQKMLNGQKYEEQNERFHAH